MHLTIQEPHDGKMVNFYLATKDELEDLRTAIIKDFVAGLEPVAFATTASVQNAKNGNDIIAGKQEKANRTIKVVRKIPLYDLSDWK